MQLNLTLKPATANNSWKDDSESGERRNLLNRAFVDGASMLFYDDDSTKLAEWKHSDWCSRSGGAMNRWTNMLRWVAHPNLDVELKSLAIPQKSWTGWQRLHRQLLCCRFSVIYIGPYLSLSLSLPLPCRVSAFLPLQLISHIRCTLSDLHNATFSPFFFSWIPIQPK